MPPIWYNPAMSRLCFGFLSCFATILPGAHAEAAIKPATIIEAAACPAMDPVKCPALQQILNAGPEAMPVLLKSLQSEESKTRRTAARIIGRAELGPAAVRTTALLGALKDTPGTIAGETLQALGRVADPSAIPTLTDALSTDTEDRNRIFAANALGNYDNDLARTALVAALTDKHARVRLAAVTNLGRIGNAGSIGPLIDRGLAEITTAFVREAVATALGRLKDRRALAPLVLLLGNKTPAVRSAAIRALAALGDKAAVPSLLVMTSDALVIPALTEALAALGDPRGGQALLSIAQNARLTKDQRSRALWALGTLALPTTVAGIAGLLNDRDEDVMRSAVEALGRIKAMEGADPLAPLLDHTSLTVRKSVVWSLQEISGQKFGMDAGAWRRWLDARKPPAE